MRPYDVLAALVAGALLALIAATGRAAAPNCYDLSAVAVVAPGPALGAPWEFGQ